MLSTDEIKTLLQNCDNQILSIAVHLAFAGSLRKGEILALTWDDVDFQKGTISVSKTLKRVTLELGGNDPAIVCPGVNIKETAPKIAQMALLNSGQICIAIKRVYVHASIYQEFLAAVVQTAESLLVGDGFSENVYMGPIQNSLQYERVQGFLKDAKEANWEVALDKNASESNGNKGYFIRPTIFSNPPDDSRIVVEEPFGQSTSYHVH